MMPKPTTKAGQIAEKIALGILAILVFGGLALAILAPLLNSIKINGVPLGHF